MNKIAVYISMFFVSVVASAEPIQDIDAFQGKIEKCIKGAKPDVCMNKLLPLYFPPGNVGVGKSIEQASSMYTKWLGSDTVYMVHPIKTSKVGDLVERRVYAIETMHSDFMVLDSSYIRLHGDLYLYRFNLSNKDEKIEAMLNNQL